MANGSSGVFSTSLTSPLISSLTSTVPSAPPMFIDDQVSQINWGDHPIETTPLGCLASETARQYVRNTFITLSSLSLGATVYAALFFTATPLTVLYTVAGLAALT